jgi:hypothetical protein
MSSIECHSEEFRRRRTRKNLDILRGVYPFDRLSGTSRAGSD